MLIILAKIEYKNLNILSGREANLPSSYRPISLISSLGRVYERIILTRLKEIVETKQPFIKEQFSLRSHHSSIHRFHRLSDYIAKYNVDQCSATQLPYFQTQPKSSTRFGTTACSSNSVLQLCQTLSFTSIGNTCRMTHSDIEIRRDSIVHQTCS